eukprot:1318334-Rhodomonas_salina.1
MALPAAAQLQSSSRPPLLVPPPSPLSSYALPVETLPILLRRTKAILLRAVRTHLSLSADTEPS